MNWILLILAGFFEAGFAVCLGKAHVTDSPAKLLWYGGFFIFLTCSMVLLSMATRSIPVGTAYAVWTGTGAALTTIAGILVFNEPADLKRLFFLTTLILSIAGLKYVSER